VRPPGAHWNAEIPTLSTEARVFHSICQGERWERVDYKLKQRRVVLQRYNYTSNAACVLLQLASDMSHCPSILNNATKALQRAFISSRLSKPINEEMHCCGLLKTQEYYKNNSCPYNISLG
jgi:hypothetical protein